ncbi:MAG TPA: TRAP transporter small permease subunit, partial [Candidatus Dormibacteraeota bacterium]|nr:TRAP transporter small permease subunit [Candidatus Dormibacteraeota bacterium]
MVEGAARRGPWPRLVAVGKSVEDWILALFLVSLGGVLSAEVLMVNVFNRPLIWSSDIATDLFYWLAFWGLAVAVRARVHVALFLFDARLPRPARQGVQVLRLLLMGLFLALLARSGIAYCWATRTQPSGWGFPLWLVYAAVPAGS